MSIQRLLQTSSFMAVLLAHGCDHRHEASQNGAKGKVRETVEAVIQVNRPFNGVRRRVIVWLPN